MESVHSQEYRRFLARLRQARRESGLRQAEVAARLGKHQNFVSRCESGERRVDIAELIRFARVYGKPVTFFFRA